MLPSIPEFLQRSRQVTDNYIKARGKWDELDQWAKIAEEEKEFATAKTRLNELEEFWDNFFAKLTLLHLQGINDYAIIESMKSTLKKIEERSIKELRRTTIVRES